MDAHLGWGIALVEPLRVFWGVGRKDRLLAETGVQELTELKQKEQTTNKEPKQTKNKRPMGHITHLKFSAQVS